MASVLVLGATGYIGGMLVPRLLADGHTVRCLARVPEKILCQPWGKDCEVVLGDILNRDDLLYLFQGIEVVFYLIHSMSAGERQFEGRDRIAASHVADLAGTAGVRRIVYLGGLGRRNEFQSPHLRSRHEVGDILRTGRTAVTEFRAAIIVGAGSVSFDMIYQLVTRLPAMICPRWVGVRTQPIGVLDVLKYLLASVDHPDLDGKIIDIGGPEVLTYYEMMLRVAKVLHLRRWIFRVPVLTPRLSSYWVNLVTPVPTSLARSLIESLRHETICENELAQQLFSFEPAPFEEAVSLAIEQIQSNKVEMKWTFAAPVSVFPSGSRELRDTRKVETGAPADRLFSVVAGIGGETGWYYANWLWGFRGFIDKQFGGVGLRRGRRHPTELIPGEALDFWRVEAIEPGSLLRLRAEMKVFGNAWLEFRIEPLSDNQSRLIQTAIYRPRGLAGLLYWYTLLPVHLVIFRGMARAIARRACGSRG